MNEGAVVARLVYYDLLFRFLRTLPVTDAGISVLNSICLSDGAVRFANLELLYIYGIYLSRTPSAC